MTSLQRSGGYLLRSLGQSRAANAPMAGLPRKRFSVAR